MRNVLLVISAQSHFQKLCIKYLFSKSQWLETGEKHFACDQCPKSFSKELHEISISFQSHSGEKLVRNVLLVISAHSLFQKSSIKSLFLFKVIVVRNQCITGEKRFACDQCPKSFSKELYEIFI